MRGTPAHDGMLSRRQGWIDNEDAANTDTVMASKSSYKPYSLYILTYRTNTYRTSEVEVRGRMQKEIKLPTCMSEAGKCIVCLKVLK